MEMDAAKFDAAMRALTATAMANGSNRMMNAVLRWMVAHKAEISREVGDALIAHMGREQSAADAEATAALISNQLKGDAS